MSFEKVSFPSSVGNFGIRALKSVAGLLRVEKCKLLWRPNKASVVIKKKKKKSICHVGCEQATRGAMRDVLWTATWGSLMRPKLKERSVLFWVLNVNGRNTAQWSV